MGVWSKPLMIKGIGNGSGEVVSFLDGDGGNFRSLNTSINFVQSGSGEPSPDNIRPISGWSAVNLYRESVYDPTATPYVTVTFPSPPDIVYSGTLDLLTGVLTDYGYFRIFDGTEDWVTIGGGSNRYVYYIESTTNIMYATGNPNYMACSHLPIFQPTTTNTSIGAFAYYSSGNRSTRIVARLPSSYGATTSTVFKQFLAEQYAAGTPYQFYFRLNDSKSTVYQLVPQQLQTLFGQNNVWSDCGITQVQYSKRSVLYMQ